MSWTFHVEGPFNDTTAPGRRNRIRRIVGDTHGDPQLLQDEELDDILAVHGNDIARSALEAVEGLIARTMTRPTSRSMTDGRAESYANRLAHLEKVREILMIRTAPQPFAGGISIDDVEEWDDDTDNRAPLFHEDLHRHRGDEPIRPEIDNR